MMPSMSDERTDSSCPTALVASWYPIQDESSGGRRRVSELLRALAPRVRFIQPLPAHPGVPGAALPVDFGSPKLYINWGMFNLYWPSNRRLVRRLAAQWRPSVIVSASIWCHSAFAGLGIPRVFDAQNADARTIADRFGPRHPVTRIVARLERRVLRESEIVFCCSDIDAASFRSDYGIPPEKIIVVPNGVTIPETPAAPSPEAAALRARDAGKTVLYFMGKTDYAPNADAMRWIARHLLPELERRAPGRFVCWISGGGPGLPSGAEHPSLRWLGRVPSVAPWLAAADITLAPVESGGGTRLKILEFLGAGKPLVATPKAAEGIDLVPGAEADIVPLEDMPAAILRLAADPARAAALGTAGLAKMRAAYTWESIRVRWRSALARYGI